MSKTLVREEQDVLVTDEGRKVRTLGMLGFSTTCIMKQTGLTKGAVLYALKKAKVKRSEYRDGKSVMSKLVINKVNLAIPLQLKEAIRAKTLKLQK